MSHIIQSDSDLAGRQTRDNNRDQISLSLSLSISRESRDLGMKNDIKITVQRRLVKRIK